MIYAFRKWRLICDEVAVGSWNMAVDEAILEAVIVGEVSPTLRLYAWEPPCLSLGYAQPISDISIKALEDRNWDLVRRPTGGRAILHADELTYSICSTIDDPLLAGGVLGSYKTLAKWLLNALRLLGIEGEVIDKKLLRELEEQLNNAANQNPVCFEVPSSYEMIVRGKKIIGSAQVRRKGGVLQHGSLPLKGDLTRIIQVLNLPRIDPTEVLLRLLERAITVEQVLGRIISWNGAAQAFSSAFHQTFDLDLQNAELTSSEQNRAKELVKEKYTNYQWTGRI